MGILYKPLETAGERDGVAQVHYSSWRETYPGLIDSEYINGITLEKRIEGAKNIENAFIALDGDRVVGFICYGSCKDEDETNSGEIYSVYVLREYQKMGIGKALTDLAMREMRQYGAVNLWVLQGNERAIGFYENYGFAFDGKEKEEILGKPCTELRMKFIK